MRSLIAACLLGVVSTVGARPAAAADPTIGGTIAAAVGPTNGTCAARSVARGTRHPVDISGTFTDTGGHSWSITIVGCGTTIPRTGGWRIRARITLHSTLGTLSGTGPGGATFLGGSDLGLLEYYEISVVGSDGLSSVRRGRVHLELQVPLGAAQLTGSVTASLPGCTVCS